MTITNAMEELSNALFMDEVPESWNKKAYPSLQGLAAWFVDLLMRIKELEQRLSEETQRRRNLERSKIQ